MTATILDGKKLAQQIRAELTEEVIDFIQNNSVVPSLAAVLVGDDPASEVYVRNKRRACEEVGIESQLHRLPAHVPQDEMLQLVAKLNKDQAVHGILVQMPLPAQVDTAKVLMAVSPAKDVDAFHPENVGRLVQGRPRFLPCTPHGVQQLLMRSKIEIAGRHVVIVGRSHIVGKPLAIMLAQRGSGGDATVTVCHSRTRDLAAVTRLADILIVAIGRPKFITAEMVKPGAVVVDVGINRIDTGLVGDVDFAAGAITPVPGGVGPLTIAMLLKNTLAAAEALET
jgi:methylenetetrahydrofolate dehydrogenase (NADP+) / methenyltetrahydrofolate cyclohydrolase